MSFIRDPQDEQKEEQLRLLEVRWFYKGLVVFTGLFLFLFYIFTGVHWWEALLLDSEQYPFHWGRFAARLLAVPVPALFSAFYISDVRSWWAPLVYLGSLCIFVVLIFLGMGVTFW